MRPAHGLEVEEDAGMLDPRRYTDDRLTAAVYVLHNEGKAVPKISRLMQMPESEVRRRIVDVWTEHKMRMQQPVGMR